MTTFDRDLVIESANVQYISGPLVFVGDGKRYPLGAIVDIIAPDDTVRRGQVLETSREHAVIQVLETTSGLDTLATRIRLRENIARVFVGPEIDRKSTL